MLDRLVSGAGAITDAADRSVRLLTSGSGRAVARTRPGSLLVAAVLAVLAVLLVLAGLEATDPATPIDLSPAVVATSSRLADRTYATISGSIDGGYSGTYRDENGNGVEDPGETDRSWYYWLVDPTRRTGIAVRSSRPPAEVFTFTGRGVVRSDVGYAFDDDSGLDAEAARTGLLIDKDTLIDTTVDAAAAATLRPRRRASVRWARPSRSRDRGLGRTSPSAPATRIGTGAATTTNRTASRSSSSIRAPRHGVRVLLRDWPEFSEATMTGLLRREERTAAFAKGLMGADFDGLDLRVSDRYVLNEPETPAGAPAAFALAAGFAAVAVAIVVGLAGGYLVYRPAGAPLPPPATTLGPGGAIPLRITGIVRTPAGTEHVREVPGSLVRFMLRRAEPSPEPSTAGDPVAAHDDASAPESSRRMSGGEPADEAATCDPAGRDDIPVRRAIRDRAAGHLRDLATSDPGG